METLRTAMQKDGPTPGYIHIVVARRIGPPTPSPSTPNMLNTSQSPDVVMMAERIRNSVSPERPLVNNNSNNQTVLLENDLSKQENNIDTVDHPSQQNNRYSSKNQQTQSNNSVNKNSALNPASQPIYSDVVRLRNPVLDRLTGVSPVGQGGLRNDSYSRAVHDSFNDSQQGAPLEDSHISSSSSASSPEKHPTPRPSSCSPLVITTTAPTPGHSTSSNPKGVAPLASPTIRSSQNDSVMIDDHHFPLVHRVCIPEVHSSASPLPVFQTSCLGFLCRISLSFQLQGKYDELLL